jgi:hypothetical protein
VSSMHVGAREWRPKTAHGAFIASRHSHHRYRMACQIVAAMRETIPKLTDTQRERLSKAKQIALMPSDFHSKSGNKGSLAAYAMKSRVAVTAQRNQVIFGIFPGMTPKFLVMHLQVA